MRWCGRQFERESQRRPDVDVERRVPLSARLFLPQPHRDQHRDIDKHIEPVIGFHRGLHRFFDIRLHLDLKPDGDRTLHAGRDLIGDALGRPSFLSATTTNPPFAAIVRAQASPVPLPPPTISAARPSMGERLIRSRGRGSKASTFSTGSTSSSRFASRYGEPV